MFSEVRVLLDVLCGGMEGEGGEEEVDGNGDGYWEDRVCLLGRVVERVRQGERWNFVVKER